MVGGLWFACYRVFFLFSKNIISAYSFSYIPLLLISYLLSSVPAGQFLSFKQAASQPKWSNSRFITRLFLFWVIVAVPTLSYSAGPLADNVYFATNGTPSEICLREGRKVYHPLSCAQRRPLDMAYLFCLRSDIYSGAISGANICDAYGNNCEPRIGSKVGTVPSSIHLAKWSSSIASVTVSFDSNCAISVKEFKINFEPKLTDHQKKTTALN